MGSVKTFTRAEEVAVPALGATSRVMPAADRGAAVANKQSAPSEDTAELHSERNWRQVCAWGEAESASDCKN